MGCRSPSRWRGPASTSRSCATSGRARARWRRPGRTTRCRSPAGTGLGKPLKASIHPLREDIPIYLGAEGPKNIALAAELCDGWLALFFSPTHQDLYTGSLQEGFAREGARRSAEDFEVAATVPFIVTDDVDAGADSLRPLLRPLFRRDGRERHQLPRQRADRDGLRARGGRDRRAVPGGAQGRGGGQGAPPKLIEEMALIGPREKIRDELDRWRESIVTTLLLSGDANTLRTAAELVLG